MALLGPNLSGPSGSVSKECNENVVLRSHRGTTKLHHQNATVI